VSTETDSTLPTQAAAINMIDGNTCVAPGVPGAVAGYWSDARQVVPVELMSVVDVYGARWDIDPSQVVSVQEVNPASWPAPTPAAPTS
jgi:hypothetical protein